MGDLERIYTWNSKRVNVNIQQYWLQLFAEHLIGVFEVIGIELKSEIREKITRELLGFLQDECEVELSQFRGEMVVEFVAKKISSEIYNSAILDARAFLSERLEDMEATLYAQQS